MLIRLLGIVAMVPVVAIAQDRGEKPPVISKTISVAHLRRVQPDHARISSWPTDSFDQVGLKHAIQQAIAPGTWKEQGGTNEIAYHELGMAIVVQATANVVSQVEAYVRSLEDLVLGKVEVECELLVLSEPGFGRLGFKKVRLLGIERYEPTCLDRATLFPPSPNFPVVASTEDTGLLRRVTLSPMTLAVDQRTTITQTQRRRFIDNVELVGDGSDQRVVPKLLDHHLGLVLNLEPDWDWSPNHMTVRFDVWVAELGDLPVQQRPLTRSYGSTTMVDVPRLIERGAVGKLRIKRGTVVLVNLGKATLTDQGTSTTNHLVLSVSGEQQREPHVLKREQLQRLLQRHAWYVQNGFAPEASDVRRQCLLIDPDCFNTPRTKD